MILRQKLQLLHAGDSKPKEAAQDAASTVKSALPDEPKQGAKDAASAVKDNLPEAPSNPFKGFFSGKHTCLKHAPHASRKLTESLRTDILEAGRHAYDTRD